MNRLTPALMAELLQESLRQGQRPLLTVTSNSMSPLLRRGDQVTIEAISAEQLQPGDTALFAAGDWLISHRYWGRRKVAGETWLLTRGDHQRGFDAPWPASQLTGRVVGRWRHGRYLSLIDGPGGRLNRLLSRLVAIQMTLLGYDVGAFSERQAQPDGRPPGGRPPGGRPPGGRPPGGRPRLLDSLIRYVFFLAAFVLATAAYFFSQRETRQE
jgi:signal peptidase I